MSDNNQNHRDARTIEADLARNRAELEATVDKLQYKFRPGEVFDQAWRYARSPSTDQSDSRMKESLVRNPLPVALIGVGVAWLLLAGRDGSVPSRQESSRRDARSTDNVGDRAASSGRPSDRTPATTASRGTAIGDTDMPQRSPASTSTAATESRASSAPSAREDRSESSPISQGSPVPPAAGASAASPARPAAEPRRGPSSGPSGTETTREPNRPNPASLSDHRR